MSSPGTIRRIGLSSEALRRHAKQFVLAYVLLFMVLGFVTLPRYGFTWDEGVGDVFFGERYIRFFTSLNPAYLDFDDPNLDVHQRSFNVFSSSYRDKPNEFLPVGNTVSGMTMELFGYRLGWLDPVDAFHFGKVLLAGLLLWGVFNFAAPRLGTLTAGLGVLILSTFPRFWGDMHFNPLDLPEAVFSALTIFAFYFWSERPSWKRAGLVGILFGCALGSKSTAHFIPIILFFGMFPFGSVLRLWTPTTEHLRKYLWHYVFMLVLAAIFFFFAWPYFYGDPLGRLQTYYNFVFTEAYTRGTADWNLDPLYQAITTMPEIDLVLLAAGIAFAVRKTTEGKSRLAQLLLAWLAVPILRASLPGAANFDGIRHFEEFVPAACLLAAFGGAGLVNLAARFTGRKMVTAGALTLLIVLNVAAIEVRYFPYDYLYYNSLVGGLGGAQRISSDATDYWGGSYRSGVQWLNYNAEKDAQVHVAIAPWIVKLTSPIWLRSDIGLIEEPVVRLKVEQGYPVYVMFITRPGWYNNIASYVTENLKPVHRITVDGATILVIYKLDDPTGIPN